jgi:hypothetical protein
LFDLDLDFGEEVKFLMHIFDDKKNADFLIVVDIHGTKYTKLILTTSSPTIDH